MTLIGNAFELRRLQAVIGLRRQTLQRHPRGPHSDSAAGAGVTSHKLPKIGSTVPLVLSIPDLLLSLFAISRFLPVRLLLIAQLNNQWSSILSWLLLLSSRGDDAAT
jgi:hypothetical protein